MARKGSSTKHSESKGIKKGLGQALIAPGVRKYKNNTIPIAERTPAQSKIIRSGGGRARITASVNTRKALPRGTRHTGVLDGMLPATAFIVMADYIHKLNAAHASGACVEGCPACDGTATLVVHHCLNVPKVKDPNNSLEALQISSGINRNEVVRVVWTDTTNHSKGKRLIAKTQILANQVITCFKFDRFAERDDLIEQSEREYSVTHKDGRVGIPFIGKHGWKIGCAQYLNHACANVATVKLVNPKPSTLKLVNPEAGKPSILNPKPSTLNPKS
jgi:hypothetical protein